MQLSFLPHGGPITTPHGYYSPPLLSCHPQMSPPSDLSTPPSTVVHSGQRKKIHKKIAQNKAFRSLSHLSSSSPSDSFCVSSSVSGSKSCLVAPWHILAVPHTAVFKAFLCSLFERRNLTQLQQFWVLDLTKRYFSARNVWKNNRTNVLLTVRFPILKVAQVG